MEEIYEKYRKVENTRDLQISFNNAHIQNKCNNIVN